MAVNNKVYNGYNLDTALRLLSPADFGWAAPKTCCGKLKALINQIATFILRTSNLVFGDHRWYNNAKARQILTEFYSDFEIVKSPHVEALTSKVTSLYRALQTRSIGEVSCVHGLQLPTKISTLVEKICKDIDLNDFKLIKVLATIDQQKALDFALKADLESKLVHYPSLAEIVDAEGKQTIINELEKLVQNASEEDKDDISFIKILVEGRQNPAGIRDVLQKFMVEQDREEEFYSQYFQLIRLQAECGFGLSAFESMIQLTSMPRDSLISGIENYFLISKLIYKENSQMGVDSFIGLLLFIDKNINTFPEFSRNYAKLLYCQILGELAKVDYNQALGYVPADKGSEFQLRAICSIAQAIEIKNVTCNQEVLENISHSKSVLKDLYGQVQGLLEKSDPLYINYLWLAQAQNPINSHKVVESIKKENPDQIDQEERLIFIFDNIETLEGMKAFAEYLPDSHFKEAAIKIAKKEAQQHPEDGYIIARALFPKINLARDNDLITASLEIAETVTDTHPLEEQKICKFLDEEFRDSEAQCRLAKRLYAKDPLQALKDLKDASEYGLLDKKKLVLENLAKISAKPKA